MKRIKKVVLAVSCILIFTFGISGCATISNWFCQLPQADIDTAAQTLHTADQVYDFLIEQKLIPDNTKEATLALSGIDTVVALLKKAQTGHCVPPVQLNAAVATVQAAEQTANSLNTKNMKRGVKSVNPVYKK
jgi:hypothetical protein